MQARPPNTTTAEAFAAQLVTEQASRTSRVCTTRRCRPPGRPEAVEQNAMMLRQKIAERTKLLSQLEQAKMQGGWCVAALDE